VGVRACVCMWVRFPQGHAVQRKLPSSLLNQARDISVQRTDEAGTDSVTTTYLKSAASVSKTNLDI
jgi:hypothetical protein